MTVEPLALELPPGTPASVDLRVAPIAGEHPSEYIKRVRSTVIASTSPGDYVPNIAQIKKGPLA